MSDSGSLEAVVERLLPRVRALEAVVVQQRRVIAEQADRIGELERRLGRIPRRPRVHRRRMRRGMNSPRRKRSSRSRSGRKPGKQPGSASVSRDVVDDPDQVFEVAADRFARCAESLEGAAETARVPRQVVDVEPPPLPKITEYQLVLRRCGGCGHVNDPTATDVPHPVDPGSGLARPAAGALREARAPEPGATEPATESGSAPTGTPVAPDPVVAWVLHPGSPVRIGPQTTAPAALLSCGHYLPLGRVDQPERDGVTHRTTPSGRC